MGKVGKQFGRTGKSIVNPLKVLKEIRVGDKKLDKVELPETHNLLF